MELEFEHTIYYSTEKPVPIEDIVLSLSALERIYKRAPKILGAIYPQQRVNGLEVLLGQLESNSLFEKFIIKLFFENEEQLDAFIDDFKVTHGIQDAIKKHPLFSLIVAILMYQGGKSAVHRFTNDDTKSTKIEYKIENLYLYAEKEFNLDKENFRQVIENNTTDKKQLPYDVMNSLKPTRNDNKSEIIIDNKSEFTIKREYINLIPDNSEEVELTREFDNVKILIRATDLDSYRRGWGVIIPSISEKRVRLELNPIIDPSLLVGNEQVNGDVIAIYKVNDSGNLIPKIYYLERVIPNK